MAEIKGIGGAFILSEDPDRLAAWYVEMLGMRLDPHPGGKGYYRVFSTRDVESSIVRANPVFAIQPAPGKLASTGRGFVVNLRVDDLRKFLLDLGVRGIESEPIIDDPYGLFSAISDRDGNRLELYEEKFPDEREVEDGKRSRP